MNVRRVQRREKMWSRAILLTLIGWVLVSIPTAYAHTRVELGPYTIVIGWAEEPVIVGERNALVFEITEGEEPVAGAESGLNAEVLYAGRTFRANLNPTTTPGFYTAELLPTVRGQYEVRLFGTLGDLEVDEILEPEEVLSAALLQFPETPPDPRQLQEAIDQLTEQLQTARTVGYAGIGIGLLGLILAVLSLVRRR